MKKWYFVFYIKEYEKYAHVCVNAHYRTTAIQIIEKVFGKTYVSCVNSKDFKWILLEKHTFKWCELSEDDFTLGKFNHCVLENWSVDSICNKHKLLGYTENHYKFKNNGRIITSNIISQDGNIVKTKNSSYLLMNINMMYLKYLKIHDINLDVENPIKTIMEKKRCHLMKN